MRREAAARLEKIALRKQSSALSRGDLTFLETGHPKLIALTRSAAEETLLAFHNFSREEQEIPASLLEGADEVLLSSYDREGGYRGPLLRPYESVMFRMRKD